MRSATPASTSAAKPRFPTGKVVPEYDVVGSRPRSPSETAIGGIQARRGPVDRPLLLRIAALGALGDRRARAGPVGASRGRGALGRQFHRAATGDRDRAARLPSDAARSSTTSSPRRSARLRAHPFLAGRLRRELPRPARSSSRLRRARRDPVARHAPRRPAPRGAASSIATRSGGTSSSRPERDPVRAAAGRRSAHHREQPPGRVPRSSAAPPAACSPPGARRERRDPGTTFGRSSALATARSSRSSSATASRPAIFLAVARGPAIGWALSVRRPRAATRPAPGRRRCAKPSSSPRCSSPIIEACVTDDASVLEVHRLTGHACGPRVLAPHRVGRP